MKKYIILLVLLTSLTACSQKNKLSTFSSENELISIPEDTLIKDRLIIEKLSKDIQAYQDFRELGCSLCYDKYSKDSTENNFGNTFIDLFNFCEPITPRIRRIPIGVDSVKCRVLIRFIGIEKRNKAKSFFEDYIQKESKGEKLSLKSCKELFDKKELRNYYLFFINNKTTFMERVSEEDDYLNFGYAKVYTE
ncbi:hypothetical protein ETU10_02595 [Apibacter muscae]|uniref:hypothetical protein n=1 Tax=Apibacter muscae TaxID=2509004 RepID=UPI0011ABCADE|nr:hypothetical protein [Apibacter muscae]TWP24869.1 hypothetical protein ETU10_02595 [Apibacter muscae]